MAFAPKKTYSRRENEHFVSKEREKENVDPFDVLLASPLKQDVQFQPLGFWGKKVKELESKKKKELKCNLYEDSDVLNSSWKKSKPRTLQPKCKISKITDRRKNHSTSYSIIKVDKQHVLPNETITLKSAKEILKSKEYLQKHKNEILNLSSKSGNNSECLSGGTFSKTNEQFSRTFPSVKFKSRNQKININKCEGSPSAEQLKDINENVVTKIDEHLPNKTSYFNEKMEERLVLLNKGCNRFRFVTIKRHYNFPTISKGSFNDSSFSDSSELKDSWNEQTEITSSDSLNMSEDYTIQAEFSDVGNETLCTEDFVNQLESEGSDTILESLGVSCHSDFIKFSNSELEDIIEELLEQESDVVNVTAETSTTSDDTFSEQETVIKISPESQKKNSSITVKRDGHSDSCTNEITHLTTGISDLSISQMASGGDDDDDDDDDDDEPANLEIEKSRKLKNNLMSSDEDEEDKKFPIELRNVTKKRGWFLDDKNEKSNSRIVIRRPRESLNKSQDAEPFELSCIMSRQTDWDNTISWGNPVFESTRVFDMGPKVPQKHSNRRDKTSCFLGETQSGLDHTYALKPGKKWVRSMSVLRQIQNGTLREGVFESTRITKGRNFESFVQDLLKMQNEKSNLFITASDITLSNKTLTSGNVRSKYLDTSSSHESVYEGEESEEFNDSVLSKTISHKTALGKSMCNHTVKVVQSQDSSSAFRSALGLGSHRSSLIQDIQSRTNRDSIREESSDISARDFILIQCGQEDVLPFEEYFNEKTLPECKKIGEGVYGEVFMSSDTVIKIIPIEGSDMVNGAPQKTFEEIISEVVIASKLSNLRKGETNRTDGFSEMKRCWCVKGKYPKHLLKLWNDYDQAGSGSENDSPIMFKDDQLYIILELANGGKDLETFVFSSSLQALSVFIQTAFSLAAAEKAFEFEHRDLHWGNVLISKTNDKFTSVALDGVDYKIPTKGVKVCIIDFTLSRINHEGCCIFNDLASDPELFTAHGDYQFEIYRMMLRELNNDWSLFNPKTNLFWLHYTIDKMIKMVRYKIRNSKLHKKHMRDLKILESVILENKNSSNFVLSKSLNDVLTKL